MAQHSFVCLLFEVEGFVGPYSIVGLDANYCNHFSAQPGTSQRLPRTTPCTSA